MVMVEISLTPDIDNSRKYNNNIYYVVIRMH